MWARQLGRAAAASTSRNQAAEHYYLITEKITDLPPQPARARGPGLLRLLPRRDRRPAGRPVRAGVRTVEGRGHSRPISRFGEIQPDWERMGPYLEKAMKPRADDAGTSGIKKFFCGPESFTPDLRPIVGEAPELKNYFVAAGLNSIGILTGGGLGRVLAQLDRHRRSRRRRHGLQHRPLPPLPGEPRIPARAHRRVARHGLQVPLPDHERRRPRAAPSDRPSTIGSRRRAPISATSSGWEGADWYAPRGPRTQGREALLGPPELVRLVGGRAPAPRAKA